jgi:type I restriction-modification system DNA methylase subunit
MNATTHTNYSTLSVSLTKTLNKNEKKEQGIYFTPPATIYKNIEILEPFMSVISTVLEPSCGSCEFVNALNATYPHLQITAIENNENIYNEIKQITNDKIDIKHMNYFKYNPAQKYDLIIGNPPYFVMKKQEVHSSYYKYFDGRPNIFILFIIKSLSLLNDNGLLSFVLPKSFLNCLYYNKTRELINLNYKIIDIVECDDDYIETKQETVIVIIQKCQPNNTNNEYCLIINEYLIFGAKSSIQKLTMLYENSSTLHKLGFDVNVGTVVWNQCKSILTDDDSHTRLIYSSDIVDKTLSIKNYSNAEKKNYIQKEGKTETMLVINRGYGVGNYKFEYCLIDGSKPYLIENHLICIVSIVSKTETELIELYNKIINSLNNEKTKLFIEYYFGNNAINTTELKHILPIYDI